MRTQQSAEWGRRLSGALGGEVRKESLGSGDDELQNELVLIAHHVHDAQEGLGRGDADYAKNSLHDIEESVRRLAGRLPEELRGAVDAAFGGPEE